MALKDGKKSDYVGNHGGAYTDIDGMRKQFTTIDYDKKTKIPVSNSTDEKPWSEKEYRLDLLKRIFDQPASICPLPFADFTLRGEGRSVVQWNEDMLLDSGMPTKRLSDLAVLLENTAEIMGLTSKIIKTY